MALKLRETDGIESESGELENEWATYQRLGDSTDLRALDYFELGDCSVLVLPLMGLSLQTLFDEICNKLFSERTVLMIADQLLYRLEKLHFYGFAHRDVKPANCTLGTGMAGNQIHLIDLGISEEINDAGCVNQPSDHEICLIGSPDFASRSAFYGGGVSEFDDLESLAYTLIYFPKKASLGIDLEL